MKKLAVYAFRFLWRLVVGWQYKKLGWHSYIQKPLKVNGKKNISIGRKVLVQYKTWLAAMPLTGTPHPVLEIGDGSLIGNFNHIYATKKIVLGKQVLTADKVYISDNIHGFEDIHTPVKHQPVVQKNEVYIGDGSWLGENVCVIGAKIGRQCVIGANSVVTRDIPDYCVAAGSPARIIKRYNHDTKSWEQE
jgi:acetyltransferase-like isoleucine patch superfamily enzyme